MDRMNDRMTEWMALLRAVLWYGLHVSDQIFPTDGLLTLCIMHCTFTPGRDDLPAVFGVQRVFHCNTFRFESSPQDCVPGWP